MRRLKNNLSIYFIVLSTFSLMGFPLFYFVYKYGSPLLGMIDFYDYYKLYKDMDIAGSDSPLNMRLVSSSLVYLLYKAGLSYNTLCAIDSTGLDRAVWFNGILVNYLCVALTSTGIFVLAFRKGCGLLLSFTGGLIYLLGFGTIFFEIMPLADSMAVLLFLAAYGFYERKSHLLVLPFMLLIFQREYVFLAFGLIALIDWIRLKERYPMIVLLYSVLFFAVYVMFRKLFFETPRYAHHTSVEFMLGTFTHPGFPLGAFIRQTLMTMNIPLLYLLVIVLKKRMGLGYDKKALYTFLFLFLQIILLSFLLSLGNNAGRYFYILSPLIILVMLNELRDFPWERIKTA